jgi:acyl-coenzyme A thioesterase PaaI-like protein
VKVNMIRALTDRNPVVRAEGRVIHLGGQTATAEGRLVGPDGKLYGHATTTCLVFELKPQPDHSVGRNPSTDR